jgi:hypothetical protein
MYPPEALLPVRPIRPFAIVAAAMLGVQSIIMIFIGGIDLQVISEIDSLLEDPTSVSQAQIDATNALALAGYRVYLAAQIVTVVTFLLWLFVARTNAERIVPIRHRLNKAWLILGWGFPILNLWYPKQIVDDIWRTSELGGLPAESYDLDRARRPPLVWAWWIAWLLLTVGGRFALPRFYPGEDLESARGATMMDLVLVGFTMVAAALAAMVVMRITAFQEARRI